MEHRPTTDSHITRLMNPKGVKFPLIDPDKQNFLDYEMSPEQYHGDRDSISSGGLRKVLRSPKHYLSWLLGVDEDEEVEEPDHFRFGSAAHMMLLEPKKFRELYVIEPEFTGFTKDGKESKNSKEAKEKKAKWRSDQDPNAQFLSHEEMQHLVGMIESVMAHSVARNLLVDGRPEVSGFFKEPETGLWCRFRPDYLSRDKDQALHLVDYKTARDVRAGLFADSIWKNMYHLQMAFYFDGLKHTLGLEPQTATFLAVEKKPPYECAVYAADDQMLEIGRQWYMHSLRLLKRCIESNRWPGVQSQAQMISLPNKHQWDVFPEFDFE